MTWICVLVDADAHEKQPGDMWYEDATWVRDHPGDDYARNRAGQPVLCVLLPSRDIWCIDRASFDGTTWGPGWARTGDPPFVTVTPSVNFLGRYHGVLTDGLLSDDLEGRTYS